MLRCSQCRPHVFVLGMAHIQKRATLFFFCPQRMMALWGTTKNDPPFRYHHRGAAVCPYSRPIPQTHSAQTCARGRALCIVNVCNHSPRPDCTARATSGLGKRPIDYSVSLTGTQSLLYPSSRPNQAQLFIGLLFVCLLTGLIEIWAGIYKY